jgi:RNA polymerase sigma factor (sigma-70 family)
MEAASPPREGVTEDQLREAERGLVRLLRAKDFPWPWIQEYIAEIMSQAQTDFAAILAAEEVENPVGLLVVIGYRRAIKYVRSERRGPRVTSIEKVFHLADERTPTPEEETLDRDRQLRLMRAMNHLPEREQKLLALVYFEGMQLGEAGRKVGWAKASATRHHQEALRKLKALVGERELLAGEIAIPAYVATHPSSTLRGALNWIEGVTESLRESIFMGDGRLNPFAEGGSALAASGGGRAAAGICAVAVACVAGTVAGVVGPGVGALVNHDDSHFRPTPAGKKSPMMGSPSLPPTVNTQPPPQASSRVGTRQKRPANLGSGVSGGRSSSPESRAQRTEVNKTPKEIARETENEFSVEAGAAESPTRSSSEANESASAPPVAARPATSPHSGNGNAEPNTTGAAGWEVGM